jgi:3-hydroxyacyl-CoA dehydrogenase
MCADSNLVNSKAWISRKKLRELDRVCKDGAVLASNTSALNIDEIASATSQLSARC